ncbi:hypothetical protein BKA70DRAFT_1219765 [Coprinopsis sp. MPI-PUGE-AT-0042]|nr:hypothetical protein BKA70DRAFT_1219765 [Coprinopsis sp. MPI-PUGE-AT-0042]
MAENSAFQNERVVLTKGSDGQIIGRSEIDDYIHRPLQYSDYSTKRPRKRKGKKSGAEDEDTCPLEDTDSQYMQFEEGHPQRKLHEYECMDAKDNLKSQHKKKYRAALGLSPEDDEDFEDFEDFDDGLDDAINADGSIDNDRLLGKNRLSRLNQMRQAQSIVAATGWMDELNAQSGSGEPVAKDSSPISTDGTGAAEAPAIQHRRWDNSFVPGIMRGEHISHSCQLENYN